LSFDTFGVLFEFNKAIHHGVLCLESLTRHEGFDAEKVSALADAVIKAKCSANAYLISTIGAAEAAASFNCAE
jgi:hypothetical protein